MNGHLKTFCTVICSILLSISAFAQNKEKPLVVRGDNLFPPFEFVNELGQPDGFNVEVMKAILKETGMKYDLKLIPWNDLQRQFIKDSIDIITGTSTISDNEKVAKVGITLCRLYFSLVSRRDNEIKSLEDARGKIIVVQSGSFGESYIKEKHITDTFIIVDDMEVSIKLLLEGKCDAIFNNDLVSKYFIKKSGAKHLRIHDLGLPPVGYSFSVKAEDDALLQKLNDGLHNITINGEFDKIYDKWLGVYDPERMPRIIIFFVCVVVILGIIFLALTFLMRDKVHRATLKLEQSEENLQMMNNQIKRIMMAGGIIPFIWNLKTDYVKSIFPEAISGFLNLGKSTTGKSVDMLIDIAHPDDRDMCTVILDKIRQKKTKNADFVVRIKSTTTSSEYDRYLKMYLYADETVTQNSDAIFGFLSDVTESKLAEEVIKKNEEFVSGILDSIPFPIAVLDVKNSLKNKFWNKQSTIMYGDQMNTNLFSFIQKPDAELIAKNIKEVYESGETFSGREDFTTIDGKHHQTISQKSAVYIGNSKYLLVVRWDVEEILRLQQYANEAERNNELILNNINSGLVFVSPEGKIQWSNIPHFSPDSPFNLFVTDGKMDEANIVRHYSNVFKLFKETVQTLKVCTMETTLSSDNVLEFTTIPVINEESKLDGVIVRVDDITDKKDILHQLEGAKEKAEESDRLKSAFLANMSHEIRTPLNAIVGFSALLKDAQADEEKSEYCSIISSNSENLLRLIGDILDLSKMEAGFIELINIDFDLSKLFNTLNTTFTPRMKEGIALYCEVPYHSCLVRTDKNRLTQVITNFITNSIKFTPTGSITFGYELVEGGFKVYVKDTGIGIRKEKQARVFGRFEKLNDVAQGTGLGLSICKTIAETAGGSVGFESEEGAGSTFWAIFKSPTHTS